MLKPASKEELVSMIIERNEGITPKDAAEVFLKLVNIANYKIFF